MLKSGVTLFLLINVYPCVLCASRDDFIRHYFHLGYTNLLISCFLCALHGTVVSLSTVKRSLKKQGLSRRQPRSDLRRVAEKVLAELSASGSSLGYRAMYLKLRRKYGLKVPRDVVRYMLLVLDPAGVRLRSKHCIVRRNYFTKGPGYCWHIDGLDKLKPYGFAIHGCIDGFSRRVLWLEVSTTNNKSSVIAGYYLKAVRKYGCPRIIRCDRGSENSRIAYLQPFLRRHGTDSMAKEKSFQYGKSASNQRIECWWSQLSKWFTKWWRDFFRMLKDNGHYDETDAIQVDCLRYAFIALLQRELNDIRRIWNTHLIRKSRQHSVTGIPNELFYIPNIQGYSSYLYEVDEGDLSFCCNFASSKPMPVSAEFTTLANILMAENDWRMPQSCIEALETYLHLLQCIQNVHDV